MIPIKEALQRAKFLVLKQRKLRHIVDWADKYFELPAVSSNNQADIRWRTYGYQKFILHAFADLNTQDVAVIKAVQMGLSKLALIIIGYESAHRLRANGIWLPRRPDRDEFANVQIRSMLEYCKEVGDQLRVPFDKKDSENTAARRGFKGSQSYCRATQRLQDVSSIPVMTAIADELSKMPRMIRDAKGDVGKSPIDGIRGRLASADAPKLNMLSTPVDMGACQITDQFNRCREKFHRHYCCPECSDWQTFDWGDEKTEHGFKWDKVVDEHGDVDLLLTAKTVYYQCRNCDHKFQNVDLKKLDDERAEWRSMVWQEQTSAWVPGNLRFDEDRYEYFAIDDLEGLKPVLSPHSVGIQVRGWMSRRKKWWQICYQFLEAVEEAREGKPGKMADWVNDAKGEAYSPPANTEYIRHDFLLNKQDKEPDWGGRIPEDAQCLTAWSDVQVDRVETLVCAWGWGEECWLIEHLIHPGDADTSDALEKVQELTAKLYRKPSRIRLPILISGIDARYKSDAVNDACSGKWKKKIIPTYGNKLVSGPIVVGVVKNQKKKRDNKGITLTPNSGKDTVYARYKIQKPGPGFIHIPDKECFTEKFIKQMVAERRGLNPRDPMRWICPENTSNEGTDLMVGNLAMITYAQNERKVKLVPPNDYTSIDTESKGANKLSAHERLAQLAEDWQT